MKKLILILAMCSAPAFAVLNSTSTRITYTANGISSVYSFSFPTSNLGDVEVKVNGSTQIGGYTVFLNSDQVNTPGGSVSFTSTPINNTAILIQRTKTLTQGTILPVFSPFPAKTVERSLDSIVQLIQQIDRDRADLAVKEASDILSVVNLNGSFLSSNTTVTATGRSAARTLGDWMNDSRNVKSFSGVVGDGGNDDGGAIESACAVAGIGTLVFPPGIYRVGTNRTCNAATMIFVPGAQLSLDGGVVFTALGRVISLGGNPNTGAGSIVYTNDTNILVNDFGFAIGKNPSDNSDDFIHFQRDVNNNSGILVKNLNNGALVDAFAHFFAGDQSGAGRGSDLRISANSAAAGRLVNMVAGNAAAFSIISSSTLGTVDTYAGNVRQLSVEPSTTAVNYMALKGAAAGSGPSLYPRGIDTNINMTIGSQGTGSVLFRTDLTGTPRYQFEVRDVIGSTAWVQAKGSNGGSPTLTTSSLVPINIAVPITYTPVTFATLGTPANFTVIGCSDCTVANPCAGGGTGAIAKRLNGAWVCN